MVGGGPPLASMGPSSYRKPALAVATFPPRAALTGIPRKKLRAVSERPAVLPAAWKALPPLPIGADAGDTKATGWPIAAGFG